MSFYNDSKATNVHAALAALDGVERPVDLLDPGVELLGREEEVVHTLLLAGTGGAAIGHTLVTVIAGPLADRFGCGSDG